VARLQRILSIWLLAASVMTALGQQSQQQEPPEPPEEDESLQKPNYSFNPIEAEKHYRVGNFYFRKGSYKAAALRFEEAVRWNPGYTEALSKLGESYEKLHDPERAIEVYRKFLEVAPDSKDASDIRKRLGTLEAKTKQARQK